MRSRAAVIPIRLSGSLLFAQRRRAETDPKRPGVRIEHPEIGPLWASFCCAETHALARRIPPKSNEAERARQGDDSCFSQICVRIKTLTVR